MPNRFDPIQPGTAQAQQVAVINNNFAQLDNENVKKLYYDSTGTPCIMIGILPDGTTGIVIAKPGKNVLDAFK